MIVQFGKSLGQVGADVVLHPARQVLALHQFQVGQGHRAGHRMAAVGVAVVELAALLDQHPGDAVAHHHATQGDVAAGHALGKGHQIRAVTELFIGEPVPQAAEGADDFVRNEQDAVLVDDALDLWPVGLGRNDHAAGTLHRLGDKGCDLVGPHFQDLFFQPASGTAAKVGSAFPRQRVLPEMRLFDVRDVGYRQIALGVHATHATQ